MAPGGCSEPPLCLSRAVTTSGFDAYAARGPLPWVVSLRWQMPRSVHTAVAVENLEVLQNPTGRHAPGASHSS